MINHTFVRVTTALLLTAMVTACGRTAVSDETVNLESAVTESSTPIETVRSYPSEVADFGGYTFTFLNEEDDFWTGTNHILDYKELTGDGLSDAIYNRNRDVEDRMNIRFEVIKATMGSANDERTLMNKSIAAMEDLYDIVYLPLQAGGKTSFDGQSTINLHTVKSLSLDKEWWNRSFIQSATIGDNLLYTTIDYVNLMGYSFCNALYFNRGMFRDHGMEFPYKMAADGKWTYDAMFTLLEQVPSLGTQTDWKPKLSGDASYGFASQHEEATITLLQGCGVPLIIKDENHVPKINKNIERLLDAYEKLVNTLSLDGNCLLINTADCQGIDFFLNNRALFYSGALGQASAGRMRDSVAEYGVLPIPKLDVTQTDYCTPLSMYTFAMNIPLTASDPERTGAIMDYLAWVSYYDVLPVLQTNMCYKGVSDPLDIEMQHMLLESETVDLGQIYGWTTSFLTKICGEKKLLAGNNTFASDWAATTEKMEAEIEKQFSQKG